VALLHSVIFSKDRPAQLDLLLRSIERCVTGDGEVSVLYKESDPTYHRGYGLVEARHPEFTFVPETTTLRFDFQAIALGRPEKYFQCLMDDDVYVRPFSLADPEFVQYAGDPEIVALVLRMSPEMDYCYTQNVITDPPEFAEDGTWRWHGRFDDWGYPYSVDGSIWTMDRVAHVLKHGPYESLNALEPCLLAAMTAPKALCYKKPRLLGIPHNNVQDAFRQNRHEGGGPVEMNERFLAGEQIRWEPIAAIEARSPHVAVEYEWETA